MAHDVLDDARHTHAPSSEDADDTIKTDSYIGTDEDRLDRGVRILGGRRMSVSGIIENIVRHHLSLYEEDFEAWRKL